MGYPCLATFGVVACMPFQSGMAFGGFCMYILYVKLLDALYFLNIYILYFLVLCLLYMLQS